MGAKQQRAFNNEEGATATYDGGEIYFTIDQAFSGVKGLDRVAIYSGTGGGDCGYWFLHGEQYLVYAYGDDREHLGTSICTRTRPLSEAAEDMSFLQQLPAEGTGITIHGVVGKPGEERDEEGLRKVEGLGGIKVTVTDKLKKRIELVTDREGAYEVKGLKPGEYEVQAALPDYYYKDESSARKLVVQDRGCGRANFLAIPNGRISGRIVDAEGHPVKKAKIVLVRADAEGRLSMRDEVAVDYVDNEKGRFEMNQIPPGEYVPGLNVTSSPDEEEPYPATYYPGVGDRSRATRDGLPTGRWRLTPQDFSS